MGVDCEICSHDLCCNQFCRIDSRKLDFPETSASCAVVLCPQFCILLPGKLVVYALSDKFFISLRGSGLFVSLLFVEEGLYAINLISGLTLRAN